MLLMRKCIQRLLRSEELEWLNPDEIQPYLNEPARRCEVHPHPSEDRINIIFAVRIMMDSVLSAPSRPQSDLLTVLGRGCQLLREDILSQISANNADVSSPPPNVTREIVELTPRSKTTRFVEESDITAWRSYPDQLVGKGLSLVRRYPGFVVTDYAVKRVKGAQYDVVYEDSGMDEVDVVDPDTLLEMVTGAELITNM